MKKLVTMYFAAATLLLGMSMKSSGQTTFDDAVMQAVQSAVTAKTHWQSTRITPMEASGANMVITQWTSKAERGVVIITLYQLESERAAQVVLRGDATSFDAKATGDIGDEGHVVARRGRTAFRRGQFVATVSAVVFQAHNRKPDHEQETALCNKFAKAVDSALRVANPR